MSHTRKTRGKKHTMTSHPGLYVLLHITTVGMWGLKKNQDRVRKESAGNNGTQGELKQGQLIAQKLFYPPPMLLPSLSQENMVCLPSFTPAFPFNQQGYIVEEIKADGMM